MTPNQKIDWDAAPLSELTDPTSPITYGVVKPGSEGTVRFIRGGDISEGRILIENLRTITDDVSRQYNRTLLRGGELLVSLVGNPGQVAIATADLAGVNIARQVGLVRLRANIDKQFVKYYLLSPAGQRNLGAHSLGSVQQVINLRDLKTVKIPLPPLPEQKAIAHILGTLDDKIELNRRMNETLESMARALFKSWFVDFDPVRAKIDGRQPPGLSAEVAALFPDKLVHRGDFQIPIHWDAQPLSAIAEITMGTSPKSSTYNEDGVGTPLINGPVEFGDYFPTKTKWTTAPTRLSEPGDLIFCVRGSTTGRRIVSDGVYCLGRGVCSIHSRGRYQAFVNRLIDNELHRLLQQVTGSVFPNLNAPQLKNFQIIVPSTQILDAFTDWINPIQQKIESQVVQSNSLAAIRDTLLPKLLSGELRVSEAEKLVDELLTETTA